MRPIDTSYQMVSKTINFKVYEYRRDMADLKAEKIYWRIWRKQVVQAQPTEQKDEHQF